MSPEDFLEPDFDEPLTRKERFWNWLISTLGLFLVCAVYAVPFWLFLKYRSDKTMANIANISGWIVLAICFAITGAFLLHDRWKKSK